MFRRKRERNDGFKRPSTVGLIHILLFPKAREREREEEEEGELCLIRIRRI